MIHQSGLGRDVFDVLLSFALGIASSMEYCANQALNICLLNLILLYPTDDAIDFRNGKYNFRQDSLGHILLSYISKICRGILGILDVQLK